MRYLLLPFIILSNVCFAQSYVGDGWAKTSVNAVVFRKNSVVTHNNIQYVSYYDSSGHVVLAKRNLPDGTWTVQQTGYKGNVLDAHNSISMMVDGDGYLHLAWDHHNNPLNYCKSVKPGSLELTSKLTMVGNEENEITYPEFHKLPSGDLIFLYRSGESGRGNLMMNRYDVKLKKWFRVQENLIDGEGERNAYWQFCTDKQGTLHLSWVWRETPDVSTNHDLCYARSKDNGKTWENSKGEKYGLPITSKSAEYAFYIPQSSDLINQTSIYVDETGNPFIATYWREQSSSIPQYQLIYNDGKKWQHEQVGERKTSFSLSGQGTKKIPVSRPQVVIKGTTVVLIFRDVERGSKVSVAIKELNQDEWKYEDVTNYSVDDWEPSYDTELWKEKKQLHLFVQSVGQGDGETPEERKPQPVYVIPVEL